MRLALLLLVAAACRARGYTIAPLTRVALTDAFSANGNGVYQTYVGVALNGQPGFTLLVDTGSSNLVVAGSGCASCAAQGVWPLFDVGQSPIVLGPASGAYGTGAQTYSGSLVAASVSVGGTSAVAVAVSVFVNQSLFFGGDYRFVAGNATAGAPSSEQGILGVGPPDLAAPGGVRRSCRSFLPPTYPGARRTGSCSTWPTPGRRCSRWSCARLMAVCTWGATRGAQPLSRPRRRRATTCSSRAPGWGTTTLRRAGRCLPPSA